jgi:hypothetical protein
MDKRTTPEQRVLEHADNRAQVWRDAADRASLRDEPILATIFRNAAWEISTGKNWLRDVATSRPE